MGLGFRGLGFGVSLARLMLNLPPSSANEAEHHKHRRERSRVYNFSGFQMLVFQPCPFRIEVLGLRDCILVELSSPQESSPF